jgi:hypothetical protein
MRSDLKFALADTSRHASLLIGLDEWRLHIVGVVRVADEMFIHLALQGPRFCTLTVRTRATTSPAVMARQVLDTAGAWLASDDQRDHAYLECDEGLGQPS